MIYADTSALVKMVAAEDDSAAMRAFADTPQEIFTSVLGATELRRAIRRNHPGRLAAAEGLLAKLGLIDASRIVLRLADVVEPATLRTLDAIHLASALTVLDQLDAFACYDARLIAAASAAGLPVVTPR